MSQVRGHTWDDFIALGDDDPRELVDGELVEIEMPTHAHERVNQLLCYFLEAWARPRKAGLTFGSRLKIRISQGRGVMPDVQFYRRPEGDVPPPGQRRPDLAVEIISPTSVRYDRIVKLAYYASIAVPEYWIVDIEHQTLERLVLEGTRYLIAEALSGDDVLAPDSFPGLAIPLQELWDSAREARALDEG